MNGLFITGMGRSGTTLLDKLLTNHEAIDVLSQPLPLIFINVKKRFLKDKGIEKYYVLNDDLISRNYSQNEFDTYLEGYESNTDEIEKIFEKMDRYSGQYTKRDKIINSSTHSLCGFKSVIEKSLEFFDVDEQAKYVGLKEPLCEEFLPYFCENDYKCIVIVRDPRDVLASANYPKRVKHFGMKKPTLFILKSWRKSAEYIYSLRNNKSFHFLRYEDLVNHPYQELGRITEFLQIRDFTPGIFNKGIFDRNGQPWLANTSFEQGVLDESETFISNKSEGVYKEILSNDELKYTEAICGFEMKRYGYQVDNCENQHKTIFSFRDRGVKDHVDLPANFSSQKSNIDKELHRIEEFKEIDSF